MCGDKDGYSYLRGSYLIIKSIIRPPPLEATVQVKCGTARGNTVNSYTLGKCKWGRLNHNTEILFKKVMGYLEKTFFSFTILCIMNFHFKFQGIFKFLLKSTFKNIVWMQNYFIYTSRVYIMVWCFSFHV